VFSLKLVSLGLCSAKPMIVPPFKAFIEVHCLKFCNCVPWFCLNYLFFLCLNLWSLISTSVINFWVRFSSLLTVLAHVHMILFLLFTQQVRHEFGGKVHFQIVFQNAVNRHKLNSQHVSSFVGGNSFVFKDKLLYLSTFHSGVPFDGCPVFLTSATEVTPLLS